MDTFSSASDSALVGSFKHLGEGHVEDEMGILKSAEVGRGGDAKTGAFSLKDNLRGEPSEGRLCLGGEPRTDGGRLHPFSSPGREIERGKKKKFDQYFTHYCLKMPVEWISVHFLNTCALSGAQRESLRWRDALEHVVSGGQRNSQHVCNMCLSGRKRDVSDVRSCLHGRKWDVSDTQVCLSGRQGKGSGIQNMLRVRLR